MQVSEAMHRYGRRPRRPGAADLRRPADRPPAARAGARRRRRRRHARPGPRPPQPRHAAPRRGRHRRPRRGRRDARHGLRRGPRGDPRRDARAAGRRCCSPPRCRPASTRIARRHLQRPGAHHDRPREAPSPARRRRCGRPPTSSPRAHKPAALGRILDVEAPTAAIVFCRTRDEVDQLTETLNGRGYRAEALHGGMSQEQRDRVMGRLRAGTADLLVATDVAARGLDIEQLTHVVNYDVPSAPESYVHRIGRVGRAGREGVAITLAEPREHRMLKTIERVDRRADRRREGADRRRPARPPARAHPRGPAGEPAGRRPRPLPRRSSRRSTDEFDLMEVALAAVKLAHEAGGAADDDEEIPQVGFRPDRDGGAGTRRRGAGASARPRRAAGGPAARLFVGAGRDAGIRPQDLVGAITGESGLNGPRHRRDRDPPAVLAGRGAGVGRRRGDPAPCAPP